MHAFAFIAGLTAGLAGGVPQTRPANFGSQAGTRLLVTPSDLLRIQPMLTRVPEAGALRDALRKEAFELLDQPPVRYRLVGPRMLSVSRECLRRILLLAGIYRLEGDWRLLRRAEAELVAVTQFKDWNPKHFLDTAEMCAAVAIAVDWLPDQNADVLGSAKEALIAKGLRPGLAAYAKSGGWPRAGHNWNQVCNGGMVLGALAAADVDPDLCWEVICRARESIALGMAALQPDGGCIEGPSYWSYALRYASLYDAALRTALGEAYALPDSAGYAQTALFRIHCIGPLGLTFNFADGGPAASNAYAMLHLARRFDQPVYAAHARLYSGKPTMLDLLWYDPRGSQADIAALPKAAWFRGIQTCFLRSAWNHERATFIGFKGGDNRANHAHLDLGTFVLDAAGQRWADDLGGDDYNLPGYFGQQRWTYYRLRTEGHNTLVINDANQDPRGAAPIVAFNDRPRAFAVADLSQGYADHARRVRRGIMLIDEGRVLVQDELDLARAARVAWQMHTSAAVRVEGRRAVLTKGGEELRVNILEPSDGLWELQEVRIPPPQRPATDIRKLVMRINAAPPGGRIAVLLDAAVGQAPGIEVRPLDRWSGPSADAGAR